MNNFDTDSLIRAGRELPLPFVLSLVRQGGEEVDVTVLRILRLLPKKRIVAVADLGGEKFLVKIFIGRASSRYMKREVTGACAIEDTGVLTASLEWQAEMRSGNGHVLAFEFIDHARNLIDVWTDATQDNERSALISKVIPVLAALHEGGVVQNDIHPENFLFRNDQIITIDGGDVSRHGLRPLDETKSLDNLALFFAQFRAGHDDLVPELLEQYRQIRAWPADDGRRNRLSVLIDRMRAERKRNHIEKAFRECTRFTCEKSFSQFSVCERAFDSAPMRALLCQLDEKIEGGKLLKDGNTATVALVEGPTGPLVIKRYNIKGLGHGFSRAFRKSRAWISWANAYRLEFLGINTVKPVALVEQRFGILRRKAYFITEYIEGPDATALVQKENASAEIVSIVEILKGMSAAGLSHGDLKASNFLLSDRGPVIIDLDSMQEHSDPIDRDRAEKKDLARFMKNWESIPQVESRFADLLG